MKEVEKETKQKYSLVTGEKIKKKGVSKIQKEHKKHAKEDNIQEKKFAKRKRKIDKKLNKKEEFVVESKTVSNLDFSGEETNAVNKDAIDVVKNNKQEVLVVRRAEKGRPVTKKRKVLNFFSYALVGFVAIFFGYICGNFYVVNVLNKVDYSLFSEESLKDDGKAVYESLLASGKPITALSAGELFVAGEYVLSLQEHYYATTVGAIQPSIGSKQDIWGYKKKTGSVYECESASKGMLSLAEKYSYNTETKTAQIYKATKVSVNDTSYPENPTWTMNLEDYKKEYGTDPDAPCVPYIVSSKTVVFGSESVKSLGGGKFEIRFNLSNDSSVINYIKQVKHMSGLQDYPTFKSITVTATINSNYEFEKIRYDESYSVVYFGVMATCSGYVENTFVY